MVEKPLQFGLIGKSLQHSFSPKYFSRKFAQLSIDAEYKNYTLGEISEFPDLIANHNFKGLNVTIPYKSQIIKYIDHLDEISTSIQAVNIISFVDGKLYGSNTDVTGFEQALSSLVGDFSNIRGAIILGNGGAAKAVQYVFDLHQIPFITISRGTRYDYRWLNEVGFGNNNCIVNTTPLGMFPNVGDAPEIPYSLLDENFFLFDLVYNPEETVFLSLGKQHGARISNGLKMLEFQAEAAWTIWNSK